MKKIQEIEEMEKIGDLEKCLKDKIYKILVVDDEKDVLDALSLTLESANEFNTDVSTAESGEVALGKLADEEFDLVLADYKMPGINGVDFLTKVSKIHPKTARILITGYSDVNTAKDAINKAKVDNYLEKPWHNKELRTTIIQALIRKNEKDLWNLKEVDNVNEALNIVKEAQNVLLDKIPMTGSKQILILEFKSPADFNQFSFKIRQMKNVSIDDMEIFENKYIVKLGIYLGSFEKIQ